MTNLIENPDPVLKAKWGPLAHVDDAERKRIMSLPFGYFKPAVKQLEKELKAMEKERKRKEAEKKRISNYASSN